MLLARADNQMKHIDKARAFTDKGFTFTRRIIALSAVGAIIVWPKIAPVFFDTTVVLTWTEFTRGFLFLMQIIYAFSLFSFPNRPSYDSALSFPSALDLSCTAQNLKTLFVDQGQVYQPWI